MRYILIIIAIALASAASVQSARPTTEGTHTIALPLLRNGQVPPTYTINVPYHTGTLASHFDQTAIFWFGRVTPAQNYADVRVMYNNNDLYVYLVAFDRRLWYDSTPTSDTLDQWDAATLYLHAGAPGTAPTANSYRFVAQLNNGGERDRYQAAYRGNGTGWAASNVPFASIPGWRGTSLNSDDDDRGWAMTFRIPFSSLGLANAPAEASTWSMAIVLHDRDSAAGPPEASQVWPEPADTSQPASWGVVRFGVPAYAAPQITAQREVTIRHGLNGADVPDAAVGGGSICGHGLDYWSEWGEQSYPGATDFNIQNQSDIADWPCFSKYYVSFPLAALPPGQAIVSARLVLHQFGNALPNEAERSYVQVLVVDSGWDEATLTWNNAPAARQNVAGSWIEPLPDTAPWPGVPREWDVSRAVAEAYAEGHSQLHLALYSSDSAYHSGKYFVSSDTGDWNAAGRPTLIVTYGDAAP